MARIGLRAAVAVTLLIVSGPALGFSVAARRAHDPDLACDTARNFLAAIIDGKARELPIYRPIYTDELGKVGYGGSAALTLSLTTHDGRADEQRARLVRLARLHSSRFDPIYVAQVDRIIWRKDRFTGEDANGESERLPPAYDRNISFWIVAFSSNEISSVRQADELAPLASTGTDYCPRLTTRP